MYNLLTQPLIHATPCGVLTLPGLLAGLARNEVESFPPLRPHQSPGWHMFLVQLAALALHGAGADKIPEDEKTWARVLRGLTPNFAEDEPWCLVVDDWAKPAFLQAPAPEGVKLGKAIPTADALDLLITSKNHDLKQAVVRNGRPEDWAFALVSLQTGEGYGGAGNQGIARMNGGSSSRSMLAFAPLPPRTSKAMTPRPGAWFRRDVAVLLETRESELEKYEHLEYPETGGLGLTWLAPWPEGEQLQLKDLDIWFIEVCRRVRLAWNRDVLSGWKGTSKATRINAKHLNGALGDPFAPVHKGDNKSFTLAGRDFDYRTLTELLLSGNWSIPLAARPASFEPEGETLMLVAEALARGNSKTEGFKSRILPIGGKVSRALGRQCAELHALAEEQLKTITAFDKALGFSLALIAAGGDRDKVKKGHYAYARDARDRLDRAVDEIFFLHLWARFEAWEKGEAALQEEERRFAAALFVRAEPVFKAARPAIPCAGIFRPRAEARAERAFFGAIKHRFPNCSKNPIRRMLNMPLKEQISRLSKRMHGLGTGPLAELRRMTVGGPGRPAFWQLAADVDGGFIDDTENTDIWMRVVKIMAILTPKGEPNKRPSLHDANYELGAVLCDGGDPGWRVGGGGPRPFLSEARFARFLSQPPKQRAETLERMARTLSAKRDPASGINCVDIAALLLSPHKESNLQNLARAYYRRLDSAVRKASQKETST